jgi:Spy/CpxP family protein refolding chaperone
MRVATVALMVTFSAALALGQAPGPPPPGAGQAPPQGPGDQGPQRPGHFGAGERHGPGMEILPPGLWWTNPEVIAKIGLTVEQQKRIQDIFLQSRTQLEHLRDQLEEQQHVLQPMLDANPPDEAKALAQIGKIADTRAELEKTDAKMLLTIRGVLTAEQWTKLRSGMRRGEGHGREMPG